MKTVTIAGVGLIGASFGLALREAGFTGDLIGVSSKAAIEAGLKAGAITRSASLTEGATADLIYLAQPVDRILATLEQLAGLTGEHTLITDAGSTKQAIVSKAKSCLRNAHFLGGHPMAGKEQRGALAAEGDLFRNRPYILTPHLPDSVASNEFRSWLVRIGARVLDMPADQHDATVAMTSHLPQMLSSALALTLSREANEHTREVFGPGLVDMTRLAMSSPELWVSILQTNREQVEGALQAYRRALEDLQVSLESDSLGKLFEVGSNWAKQLRQFKPGT